MSSATKTLKKRILPPLIMDTNQLLRRHGKKVNEACIKHNETISYPVSQGYMEILSAEYLKSNPLFLEKFVLSNITFDQLDKWLFERRTTTHIGESDRGDTTDSSDAHSYLPHPTRSDTYDMLDEDMLESDFRVQESLIRRKSMAILQLEKDWKRLDDKITVLTYLRECLLTGTNAQKAIVYVINEDKDKLLPLNTESGTFNDEYAVDIEADSELCPSAVAATTLENLRIKDIAIDDRFPMMHHYFRTNIQSVLACPLVNHKNEALAVVELHRTLGKPPFTHDDEETSNNFAVWAASMLSFSDLYHESLVQQKVNEFILHVTKILFSKIDNISDVLMDILSTTKALVQAEVAFLYLIDRGTDEIYLCINDDGGENGMHWVDDDFIDRYPLNTGIPGHVALTQKAELIQNALEDPRFCRELYGSHAEEIRSVLCTPVVVNDETMGVIEMVNHIEGNFTKENLKHLEDFGVYCALALKKAKMYELIYKSEQTYKVAMEALSYYTQLNRDEFTRLEMQEIPDHIRGMQRLSFAPWYHKGKAILINAVYMFKNLFMPRKFDSSIVFRFILTVKKNYHPSPYHNWEHAVTVAQSVYVFLKRFAKQEFSLEERLALFLGALCHDVDYHPRDNDSIVPHENPFAFLYSTPMLEMRHFQIVAAVLQNNDSNILQHLPSERFKKTLTCLKCTLTATNFNQFFRNKHLVESCLNTRGKNCVLTDDERLSRLGVCMTAADLCVFYKSWEVQLTSILIDIQRFWNQNDDDKNLDYGNARILYRENFHELPDAIVKFILYIVFPAYAITSRIVPKFKVTIERAQSNLARWEVMLHLDAKSRCEYLYNLEEIVFKKASHLMDLNFT